jgi:ATP-dependent helicase/nuclease subunit A
VVTTATRLAATVVGAAVLVTETGAARSQRPHGRRFGTLVHAVLADVPFEAGTDEIERLVALHARLVGATADEIAAAIAAVGSALSHEILRRAAAASKRGRCHRELPLTSRDPAGAFIDGVADLAFAEPDGEREQWTVVDYKTDARPDSNQAYAAQVQIYARALAAATGCDVTGVLLAV